MRGQYFSFDAIVGSVIFILALIALLSYWHSVKNYLDYQDDPLSRDVVRISDQLVTVSGSSIPCNDPSLSSLGFALSADDHRLNSTTIDCAVIASANDPSWLKKELGTPYGVSISITRLDGSNPINIGGSVPSVPNEVTNAQNEVTKIRRVASIYSTTDKNTYLAYVDIALYR